jgi:ABC-2 type transport system permease protein
MFTIVRKELSDHFSSTRFLITFALILMVAVVITSIVGTNLRQELEGVAKPSYVFLMLFTTPGQFFSLVQFIAFFGPLIGIILGFDAINRERNDNTLSKLVSQPIFRDAVINGKFLAGILMITAMLASVLLLISGLGLLTIGVVPGEEEVGRLAVYLVVSVAYVAFWMGVAILFSIVFRGLATSALAAVALWIFFSFFIGFVADLAADAFAPVENRRDTRQVVANQSLSDAVSLASPVVLYSQATSTVLNPFRRTRQNLVMYGGPMEKFSAERFRNPLPLDQSVLVVMPYLALMTGLTVLCFAASYLTFLRQEIRST